MEGESRQEESGKGDPEHDELIERDPTSLAMARASEQARQGDFRTARKILSQTRSQSAPAEQQRLDAQESSFRLDRPIAIVAGITACALIIIAAWTLFHG